MARATKKCYREITEMFPFAEARTPELLSYWHQVAHPEETNFETELKLLIRYKKLSTSVLGI